MAKNEVRTIWFDGEPCKLLSWAADKAGVKLQRGLMTTEVDAMVLRLEQAECIGPIAHDGYRMEVSSEGQGQVIASSQRALAYALLDLAENRLGSGKSRSHQPAVEGATGRVPGDLLAFPQGDTAG